MSLRPSTTLTPALSRPAGEGAAAPVLSLAPLAGRGPG